MLLTDIIELNNEPHVLTFALDITDRKKAETELLRTLARESWVSSRTIRFDGVPRISHTVGRHHVVGGNPRLVSGSPTRRKGEQLQSIQKLATHGQPDGSVLLGMSRRELISDQPDGLNLFCRRTWTVRAMKLNVGGDFDSVKRPGSQTNSCSALHKPVEQEVFARRQPGAFHDEHGDDAVCRIRTAA
jgi:hypothetical protein